MASVMEVRLDRADRIYLLQDVVTGFVLANLPSSISHGELKLVISGTVLLRMPTDSSGVFDAFYSAMKPIQLFRKTILLKTSGKLSEGLTEIPFDFPIDAGNDVVTVLHETYHGVCVIIQYLITAELHRGMLQKSLTSTCEFIVEGHGGSSVDNRAPDNGAVVNFFITQDTQKHLIDLDLRSGGFRISGSLATSCAVSQPLEGQITVDLASFPIRSIDVKLMRVETIILGGKKSQEITEIQTTQIADGDVFKGLPMPIYVILPRLFTCPTLTTGQFAVEFEVRVVVSFEGTRKRRSMKPEEGEDMSRLTAYETLPLLLVRL